MVETNGKANLERFLQAVPAAQLPGSLGSSENMAFIMSTVYF